MDEQKGVENVEVKKENGKPKQLIKEIPEKLLKSITESKDKKGQLLNQVLNISIQLVKLQNKQKTTVEKLDNVNESMGAKIQNAFNKLRLKKKTDYRWSYNVKGCFVGTLIPEPKK